MTTKSRRVNTGLLDNIGAQLLTADPGERLVEQHLRVEYIPAELIRPDPVQPRRVLPEALHFRFHEARLTPTQALRELVQLAQVAARQRGYPFSNVIELLDHLDVDTEEESESATSALGPDELLVRELVMLAMTIRDDGQVNPLTVIDATQGVSRLYRVETGERRYWATWLLRDFIQDYEGDGCIPCIIIPSGKASVFRQAKENTARSGLNAIALARQAALLLLAVHDIPKPETPVTNDFYRQALSLDLRDRREYTGDVLAAMGGLNKVRFSHYKSLLRLSDEALELADRHSVDEGKLRYVIKLAPSDHAEMIRQIIQLNLTAKQVKDICEGNVPKSGNDVKPARISLHFISLLRRSNALQPDELVNTIFQQGHDRNITRTEIKQLRSVLDAVETRLDNLPNG